MKNTGKLLAALSFVPLLLGSASWLWAQEGPLNLKLQDAIRMAAERNLDVKVELYNPALAQADLGRALGIYDPVLTLDGSYDRTSSPTGFIFTPVTRDILSLNAGISQLLTTGGTVGAAVNNRWEGNTVSYYSTQANFTVSQPILKNFGRETTDLSIEVARFNKEGALDQFKTRLSDVVAKVRQDYFRLYSLREDLEAKRTSYALASRILADTRGRVSAGVSPAMDILSAEFGVAAREKDLVDAERALLDQVDLLRLNLQLPGTGEIVPVDPPTQADYPVVESQAVLRALAERPELMKQRVTVSTADLQQRIARNRLLPDLNLNANVGFGGYDPRFNRTIERTVAAEFPVWGIGFTFSYPLGNSAAENDYIKAKLQREQAQTQLANLESTITNEVRSSIRALSSSFRQLDVTRRNTLYGEQRLNAFQKRNAVGLATTKDVIDVLNDLVTARANQLKAVVDYNNAITNLWRATGELLDQQGVKVTEKRAEALYDRSAAEK